MTYGILTEDAQWRLTNDIKRLNISDWGAIKNTPKYPHTLEYFGPLSDFNGRSAKVIEKEAAKKKALEEREPFDWSKHLTIGSEGWDSPEED